MFTNLVNYERLPKVFIGTERIPKAKIIIYKQLSDLWNP